MFWKCSERGASAVPLAIGVVGERERWLGCSLRRGFAHPPRIASATVIRRENILAEIRRVAEEGDGKAPGYERFADVTGIKEGDWRGRYWARWSDAVAEAGFSPNKMQGRSDDNEALRRYAVETERLGHPPTHAELRLIRQADRTFPSPSVYERLGPKAVLLTKVARYCEDRPELADVASILAPLAVSAEEADDDDAPADVSEEGFVYLLKSGRHYKLGRTNSLGRREYELAIQLPERAEQIHAIKTDDPAGIEGYWHRRFADRRANGEWFALTPTDVRAFKRRKFM